MNTKTREALEALDTTACQIAELFVKIRPKDLDKRGQAEVKE